MQTIYIFAVLCFVGIFTESSGSNTQIIVEDVAKRNRQLETENTALKKQIADRTAENLDLSATKAALEQEVYGLRVAKFELAEKNANLERENKSLSDRCGSKIELTEKAL